MLKKGWVPTVNVNHVGDLNERAFAALYPRLAAKTENAGLRDTRARLLAKARGRTLEIGSGAGANLPHYPAAVTELVLSEPSRHMLPRLRRALDEQPPGVDRVEVVQAGAQQLPFPDDSFDTVVCTLVLCSVPDLDQALAEIARVLAPRGQLLFLEHVRAQPGTKLGRIQDLVERPHRFLGAGCHPNRDTEGAIGSSSLQVTEIEHGRQPAALPIVAPIVVGAARLSGR